VTNRKLSSGLDLVKSPSWVEASLWRRWTKENDMPARQALFDQYLPFAKKVAADQYYKRKPSNFELADLEQWTVEALLESIDRFNPALKTNFTGFARKRLIGRVADGIASMSEIGRQSRHIYQTEKERLNSLKGKNVGSNDSSLDALRKLTIGLALGMMLEASDLAMGDDKRDTAPNGYDSLEWKSMQKKLNAEIEQLPPPQPFLIRQHYHNEISFSEIATLLKLSKGRVSQLHSQALALLQKRVGKI